MSEHVSSAQEQYAHDEALAYWSNVQAYAREQTWFQGGRRRTQALSARDVQRACAMTSVCSGD